VARFVNRGAAVLRNLNRRSFLPIAVVVFPFILLWRPLFGGEAFFWGTPLLQFIPWYRMVAAMWRSGHLPLWNPLVGCGAPLAANYQAAAFYPLNALVLVLPAEVALTWTTVLHLVLAGWGAYRWMRATEHDEFPATVAALAFSGSGFLVARAALFPSITFTFPWVAVCLWRTEVLLQRRSVRDALWLGGALGLGLLAGHAQTAFYGGLLLVAYAAFRMGQAYWKKAEGRDLSLVARVGLLFALAGGVGLGLAAVQLVPTAELMLHSQRSTGVGYRFAVTYSMWPWRLLTLFAPDLFGNPGHGDYWGYATYWEDAAYIGVLPLLLALNAVFTRQRGSGQDHHVGRSTPTFWAVVCVAALVLALGNNTPVFPFLYRHVPFFDWFQASARWLLVVTVGLSVLSSIGLQRWPPGDEGAKRAGHWVVVGVALVLGGMAAPALVPGLESTFGTATVRLGVLVALSGILLVLYSRALGQSRTGLWWATAITAFVVGDLLLFGWPLLPTVSRSLYAGSTELATLLRSSSPPARTYWPRDPSYRDGDYDAHERVKFKYFRFSDFGPRQTTYWRGVREILLPDTGMLDRVASVNNFEPMQVGLFSDLMGAIARKPKLLRVTGATHVISDRDWANAQPIWSDLGVTAYRLDDALGRAWVAPSARVVPTDEMLSTMANDDFDAASEVLVGADPGAHRTSPRGEYRLILRDTPNRVTIDASLGAPGYLVLADTWYPGWRVTVDGEATHLLRANYAFRAIWLDSGEHVVDMVYEPVSVRLGLVITLATLAVCAGIAVIGGISSARRS